jgi:hypothetical protein
VASRQRLTGLEEASGQGYAGALWARSGYNIGNWHRNPLEGQVTPTTRGLSDLPCLQNTTCHWRSLFNKCVSKLWTTSFGAHVQSRTALSATHIFGGHAGRPRTMLQCTPTRLQRNACHVDSGIVPGSNHHCDLLTREVTVADPIACKRRAHQCMCIAQTVAPAR